MSDLYRYLNNPPFYLNLDYRLKIGSSIILCISGLQYLYLKPGSSDLNFSFIFYKTSDFFNNYTLYYPTSLYNIKSKKLY